MSLESWKEEFYKTPAEGVKKGKALDHSLRKWEGLKKGNLRKHGVGLESGSVFDQDGGCLDIDGNTCALCFHYNRSFRNGCEGCPLVIVRNGEGCDSGKDHPYGKFLDGDPLPMLRLLRKAKGRRGGRGGC